MNFSRPGLKFLIAFLVFSALVYSCTKIVTTDIGSGLIPPVDGVTTKDTVIAVATKNLGFDTVAVGISDDHVLGYVHDNVFGTTTASLNFQVAPPNSNLSFGINRDSIVVDSVVLCLKYDGAWGDTNSVIGLHVYRIDPEVVFDNAIAYPNTQTFTKGGAELTENNTAKNILVSTLNDVDSTDSVYKEPITNQLRIRLNKSFGDEIVNYDSSTAYTSDSAFYTYLRGLIVQPETTGAALLKISLTDTSTHLSLYYHKLDDTIRLTRRFSPDVTTSASSNTIIRNYQGTQIPAYVASADTNQDLVFMQTSPGTKASIDISKVKGMPNVIVHRAELLMYEIPDAATDHNLFTPPNLFLSAYEADSARSFLIPYDVVLSGTSITNLGVFGVVPKLKNDNYYYSFDITRYVQGIITRSDTLYNLRLIAPYNQYIYSGKATSSSSFLLPISSPALNTVASGEILLGGGNNNQYKMRLHIVYSLAQ